MSDNRSFVRLADEIALLERYAAIEQLRLGERLRITWELDAAPLDALLPPLVLQPLLENAVYHGVEPGTGAGRVLVHIERRGDRVLARIENPYFEEHAQRAGNRMALDNIRERLQLFFDAEARLATRVADGRYVVELEMPYRAGQGMSPLRVFIADDEAPARERLRELLADIAAELPTEVVGRGAATAWRRSSACRRAARRCCCSTSRCRAWAAWRWRATSPACEQPPAVVFVTAHDRHAVEAFELNALDYLLKPVRAARLAAALKQGRRRGPAAEAAARARGAAAARVPVGGRAQPHRAGAGARDRLPARRAEVRDAAHAQRAST